MKILEISNNKTDHKKQKPLFLALISLSLCMLMVSDDIYCQQLKLEMTYDGFFDNREYFHELSPHYSLFGNRLSGGLNVSLNDSDRIHTGLSYLREFGDLVNDDAPKYYAYYSKQGKVLRFFIGVFPRSNFESMNRVLLNDTIRYYRPFMEGMGLQIKTNAGRLEGWLDWTSRQTDTIRESFLIGINGNWEMNSFFFRHQLLALHYANPRISSTEDHIQDNIGIVLTAGIHQKKLLLFDAFSIEAGTILSLDRLRGVYDWQTPAGLFAQSHLNYKLFSLDASYYAGDAHNLKYGDNFYRASNYTRLDGNLHLFTSKKVEGLVQFSVHSIEGEINYSQLFRLLVKLEPFLYSFSE